MDHLCSVVKSHFKKHWKTIAYQIHSVNCEKSPKCAFLYDCGSVTDITSLGQLVDDLKRKCIVGQDLCTLKLCDDVFIINKRKLLDKRRSSAIHIVIDISGSIDFPKIREEPLEDMFESLNEQLECSTTELTPENWCIPTIFGYLINYPILYWQDQNDENCLGHQDLKVFQVHFKNETLVSFSVPLTLFQKSSEIQETIKTWLESFPQHHDYQIKSFTRNHPIVIL
jgi:Domain of unknown function (DUF4504)